jgi:hypothetical protein
MKVETPLADVLDRLTILDLKVERLPRPEARANAERERDALLAAWRAHDLPEPGSVPELPELAAVNLALWDVEDALRAHESAGDFGADFVARARAVYQLNDRRAALKRALNLRLGSRLVEEKSYGHDAP